MALTLEAAKEREVALRTERAELVAKAQAETTDARKAEGAGQHGRAAAFQRALTSTNKRLSAVDEELALLADTVSLLQGGTPRPRPSAAAAAQAPAREAPLSKWERALFGTTTVLFVCCLVLGWLLTQRRANLEALLGARAAAWLLNSPVAAAAMRLPAIKAMAEAANVPQQEL